MARLLRYGVLLLGGAMACAPAVCAQDAPSLGDVARHARQQKRQKEAQQAKDASKDNASNPQTAKAAKHVFTNDEIPEHIGPTSTRQPGDNNNPNPVVYYPQASPGQGTADQWKAQIQSMKSYLANMKTQIDQTEQSIHYSNCISDCVLSNARQRQREEQVEMMKQQMAEMQKRMEEMQEMARRQGFGSSVYDP